MTARAKFHRDLLAELKNALPAKPLDLPSIAERIKSDRRIVRVQDNEGRGPWRPGLSRKWLRDDPNMELEPIYAELTSFTNLFDQAHARGLNIGCAVRLHRFSDWFDAGECKRLKRLGFHVADCTACEIIGETRNQVLIGLPRWLWTLPRLEWSEVMK